MKKYYYILCSLLLFSSCRMGRHHGKDVVIKTSIKNGLPYFSTSIESDSISLLVAYTGSITFNKEHNAITGMSPGGYLDFRKNDKSLFVKNKNGELEYDMSDGDTEVHTEQGKRQLIAEAYLAVKYTDSLRNPIKNPAL